VVKKIAPTRTKKSPAEIALIRPSLCLSENLSRLSFN